MKPITCADIEPTLIEYFSSADDVELAHSNQHVPQLVLTHLQSCDVCREQYQGFHAALQQPVTSELPAASVQSVAELAQYIDSQVISLKQLIHCDPQSADIQNEAHNNEPTQSAASMQSTAPWLAWIKSLQFPLSPFLATPQAGFAALSLAALALFMLLWQPTPQFNQTSVAFQTQLDITPQSVEYVYSMKREGEPKPWLAFGSSRNKLNPFLIGSLYSESVALYLQQNAQSSGDHLQAFAEYLNRFPDLSHSKRYIEKLREKIVSPQQPALTKNQVLVLFAAFPEIYKKESAQLGAEQALMFDFGAWVVNLNLAAVAHYPKLSVERNNLLYFNQRVKSIGLPSGVTKSLNKISKLLGEKSLTDDDFQQVFLQGMNLRNQLG